MDIKDSGLCDNFKVAVEPTEHLFLNYQITLNIWVKMERWIAETLKRTNTDDIFINKIILHTLLSV